MSFGFQSLGGLLLLLLLQICDGARDTLWDAVFEARVDVVEDIIEKYLDDPHLLQSGVLPTDVKRVDEENGRTALFMCGMKDLDRDDLAHRQKIDKQCKSIAKLLHHANADMNHVDKHGISILSMSSLRGLTKLSKYLIQKGNADVHHTDNEGFTPLHKAAAHGYIDTATMLVGQGAHLAAMDNEGRTPLVLLVSLALGDPIFHKQLRQFLNDIIIPESKNKNEKVLVDIDNPRDIHGRTPLHYAVIGRGIPVVRLLIEHGADPSLVDDYNVSALGMIRENNAERQAEMEDVLREGMVKNMERKHIKWLESQNAAWSDL